MLLIHVIDSGGSASFFVALEPINEQQQNIIIATSTQYAVQQIAKN